MIYLRVLFLLIFVSACEQAGSDRAFIGIRMKPLYERELKSWSLQNSGDTYSTRAPEIPVKVYFDKKRILGKLRIRGDLSRHWKDENRSYRLSFTDDTIMGMDEFDLIIPADKGFELEASAYELAKSLDLPTPDYSFVDFQINHKKFDKYLMLERWTENSFRKRAITNGAVIGEHNAWLDSVLMKEDSLYKNLFLKPSMKNDMALLPHIYHPTVNNHAGIMAMSKFTQMLGDPHIESYVDMNNLAKWMALTIYLGGEHLSLGDNTRWLYSGVSGKFTPILYDVLYFPVKLAAKECLIDHYLSKNMILRKALNHKEFYSNVKVWLDWLLNEKNADIDKIWGEIEERYNLDNWSERENAERQKIKDTIKTNIQKVRELKNNDFCA